MINATTNLDDLYNDLLRQKRSFERLDLQDETVCGHCKRQKKDHLPDGRCSSWACSNEFLDASRDERLKIDKAIVLVEQLAELWNFELDT